MTGRDCCHAFFLEEADQITAVNFQTVCSDDQIRNPVLSLKKTFSGIHSKFTDPLFNKPLGIGVIHGQVMHSIVLRIRKIYLIFLPAYLSQNTINKA